MLNFTPKKYAKGNHTTMPFLAWQNWQNTKYVTTSLVYKAVRKHHQWECKILQPCGRELGNVQQKQVTNVHF